MKKIKTLLKKLFIIICLVALFPLGWYGYGFYKEINKPYVADNPNPTPMASFLEQKDEVTKAQEAIKAANDKLDAEEQKIKDAQTLETERHNKVLADEKIVNDTENKRLSDEMDRILAVRMSFQSAPTPTASSTR
jgi:hypothetical protein